MVGLKTRAGALVAALAAGLAILGVTAAAAVNLYRLDRARLRDLTMEDARTAALRAVDGVRSVLGGLEAQVQNGTSNPGLVYALDAKVDDETLRDLMFNEPWWEPFRRSVDGFGLFSDETTALVTSHLPAGFDAHALLHETRTAHQTASGLVLAHGQVLAVATASVALPGHADWPVLAAARVVDVGLLADVARRAAASVAVTDGRRLLAAATTAGGSGDLGALKQASDLLAPGAATYGDVAVAALPLSGGLRVLAAVGTPVSASKLPVPGTVLTILAVGLALAAGAFILLARRRNEPVAIDIDVSTGSSPSIIGRYALIERIGLGGMAEIYAALTTGEGSFRRPVVIKRLRPELTADPNAVAQFCDEANLLAALRHPNIVAVHDFGRWQNQFFLAEEYVPGRDLGRVVARCLQETRAPLPVEVVAYVAHEVLRALDYAHRVENDQGRALGIVHRDVSPENIMVSPRGEVKLLDFGVVKADEGRASKTEMGVVKGNVTYMSPEQARGLEVDGRADLFSLALVMYFCCSGHPLYAAHTTYGLLMQAGAGPSPDARTAIERLPEPISTVVARATSPDLGSRYATAAEMAADLAPWTGNGAALAGALVNRLFGAELRDESRRLSAFAASGSSPDIAGASSR